MDDVGERPTGTVTFLFTDIQGSTALWETDAEAMEQAVELHDSLLRSVFDDHDGYVFARAGDGYRFTPSPWQYG